MSHIYLFSLIINLIVGTAVFLYIHQLFKNHKDRFFKIFRTYVFYFNLLVLAYFFSKYFYTNIFSGSPLSDFPRQLVFLFRLILFFIAEAGVTYTLYLTLIHLIGRKQTGTLRYGFLVWIITFSALYSYGSYAIFSQRYYFTYSVVEMIWELSFNLIIVIMMGIVVIYLIRKKENPNSSKSFAIIFLAGYLVYLIPNVYFYSTGRGFGEYADPVILLFINFCPFIWVKSFFLKQNPIEISQTDREYALELVFKKFDISGREKEIIGEILHGKSNRQISDDLFVSFHTIKNHVYNIFKKFDVTSRSQLIHKVNQYLQKD